MVVNTSLYLPVNPRQYSYNDTQYESFFHGPFKDPVPAQSFWKARHDINRTDLDNIQMVNSMARAAIYNRKLYTIRALARGDHRRKLLGILTIHLPLITAPDLAAIPNTEFIFSVEDKLEHVTGIDHPF
ncbi:hypothetical protein EYZ11_011949 [Aspergillus tanneri]|uniref:Uncharacterized protein n=1 Tax=Aspergillus tanneri TaxID=1220188 RepID=A0A4S3J3M3_9EURO|nr:hypothetical protein EYZ11_011949 [Aspergillus tanneri]